MTLLGAGGTPGGFQMGTAGGGPTKSSSSMDVSLDDMIKQNRRSARLSSTTSAANKVSNVDRVNATSRVKRDAKRNQRRGLRTSAKPTRMEIDQGVQMEANKTAVKKADALLQKNKKQGGSKAKMSKAEKLQITKAGTQARKKLDAATNKPTKKQILAARKAMRDAGYEFPPNHDIQVVPRPADQKKKQPQPAGQQPKKQQQQQQKQQSKKNTNNNNNNKRNTTGKKK